MSWSHRALARCPVSFLIPSSVDCGMIRIVKAAFTAVLSKPASSSEEEQVLFRHGAITFQ